MDAGREDSLVEMKSVYKGQAFVVVVSYARMLIAEEQKTLAIEILDGYESTNPRTEAAIRELRVVATTTDPIERIDLFRAAEVEENPAAGSVAILRDLLILKATADRSGDLELVSRIEAKISEREVDAAKSIQNPGGSSTPFSCLVGELGWTTNAVQLGSQH